MALTADTHAFLHGLETTVPGSYLKGHVRCGREDCKKLEASWKILREKGATWKHCQGMECKECASERKSRCRVLLENTPGAYALGEAWMHAGAKMAAFKDAPCIVPNNDTRTEINKARSRRFAAERGQQLQWCMAEDVISVRALNIEPDLARRKVEFLRELTNHVETCQALCPWRGRCPCS